MSTFNDFFNESVDEVNDMADQAKLSVQQSNAERKYQQAREDEDYSEDEDAAFDHQNIIWSSDSNVRQDPPLHKIDKCLKCEQLDSMITLESSIQLATFADFD